jgi:hypothetical protein
MTSPSRILLNSTDLNEKINLEPFTLDNVSDISKYSREISAKFTDFKSSQNKPLEKELYNKIMTVIKSQILEFSDYFIDDLEDLNVVYLYYLGTIDGIPYIYLDETDKINEKYQYNKFLYSLIVDEDISSFMLAKPYFMKEYYLDFQKQMKELNITNKLIPIDSLEKLNLIINAVKTLDPLELTIVKKILPVSKND